MAAAAQRREVRVKALIEADAGLSARFNASAEMVLEEAEGDDGTPEDSPVFVTAWRPDDDKQVAPPQLLLAIVDRFQSRRVALRREATDALLTFANRTLAYCAVSTR